MEPDPRVTALEPLVGRWRMTSSLAPDPDEQPAAETRFEWLAGGHFLVQHWFVDIPEAPDGIAVIGVGEAGDLRQTYFDSRGVSRVYGLSFDGHTLRLDRNVLGFSQRFVGVLDEAGDQMEAHWDINEDGTWQKDFDLTYSRIPS